MHSYTTREHWINNYTYLKQLGPGIGLAGLISLLAWGAQTLQERLLGQAWLEAIVFAILIGMLWRTLFGLGAAMKAGVSFTSKELLEFGVVLLGASINLPEVLAAGPLLLLTIMLTVGLSITVSRLLGKAFGLNPKQATLVAVGNSICGNSAIAAVAPLIEAEPEDIASSISLTAVIGVVVVLSLPLLIPIFELSLYQYGVIAGLTVYAVPQVLAATLPVSSISGEIGTLVKLVRVLMLSPIVIFLSLSRHKHSANKAIQWRRLLPWFILGFLGLAVLRSFDILPTGLAGQLREISRWLTVAAMAALGLSVDIRVIGKTGWRVGGAVITSLIVLLMISLMLVKLFQIG